MFGFIQKIKERRLAKAKAKRDAYQARKAKIDQWHNAYWNAECDRDEADYKKALKHAEEKNSVCPNCKSTNVVNHVRRSKGELHGEGDVSGSFFFGCGSVYGKSKIDGNLDTLPVCKCNYCGNEWYREDPVRRDVQDEFSSYSSYVPERLFDHVREYIEAKFDPNDVKEKYNSLDEKKAAIVEKWSKGWPFETYRTAPRYMLDFVFWKGMKKSYYCDRLSSIYGYKRKYDEYSYVMPDKLWEIVKLVIGWKGTEE